MSKSKLNWQSVTAALALLFTASTGVAPQASAAPRNVSQANKKEAILQILNSKKEFFADRFHMFPTSPANVVGCSGANPTQDYVNQYAAFAQKNLLQAKQAVCAELTPYLPAETSCEELVQVTLVKTWPSCYCWETFWENKYLCNRTEHVQIGFELSERGRNFLDSSVLFDPSSKSVTYNASALEDALKKLKLLPRERKSLESFWNSVANFNTALKAETEKAAKGQTFKPVSHRDFAAQAGVVVSYYRYLKEDLSELAQYGSAAAGVDTGNRDAVAVIEQSIGNLIFAYGLDTDVIAKRAADYGRVFVDLLTNFSQSLTVSEKQRHVRPLQILVGGRIIPTAEAEGDIAARDAILEFKTLWEKEEFQHFLREKLSASDDRANSLILNLSNLAFKIGLAGGLDIRAFDAKDLERIRFEMQPKARQ